MRGLMLRCQLPARSPLSARAVIAGFNSVVTPQFSPRREAAVRTLLREHWGSKAVLLTDSGTSALGLAIRVSASASNRPVAIPAYGCFDIATAVQAAGVPFVFYDVDPASLGPDMESLRAAFEEGADRVVAAHFYGVPFDVAAVKSLSAQFGALLIEDAAQGAGSTVDRLPAGSHGVLAVLSFGRGKGVTGGGGGALLANDQSWAERVEALADELGPPTAGLPQVAKLAAQWIFSRPSLFGIPSSLPFLALGETVYRSPHSPRRPSGVVAGTLPFALAADAEESSTRRRNAQHLLSSANSQFMQSVVVPDNGTAGYLRLPMIARGPLVSQLDSLRLHKLGVRRGYPNSLVALPDFGGRNTGSRMPFPGAERLAQRLFTIPVHGAVSRRDLEELAAWCASPAAFN